MKYDEKGNFIGAAVHLKDGVEALVRPARTEDREELETMFRSCSHDTLYTRFLSPGLGVPLRYLDRLMQHKPPGLISLVAEVRVAGKQKIVGLMNLVSAGSGSRSEIAIVVQDDYQNRGLGSAMLRCLYEIARHRGVKKFEADIDAANRRVFHLLKRSGLPCKVSIDQGVAHAEVEMDSEEARFSSQ